MIQNPSNRKKSNSNITSPNRPKDSGTELGSPNNPNTTQSYNNLRGVNSAKPIQDEKHAKTMLLIEQREKQRSELLKSVLDFTLYTIACLYIFVIIVFCGILSKIPSTDLVKLADFWHILLIILLPPTSLLMILIRGVSFAANSSEFKSSDSNHDDKDKESILDSIPTSTTTTFKEGLEITLKIKDEMKDIILPNSKEKK